MGTPEENNENLTTEHLHLGGGSSSHPLSFHFPQTADNVDPVSPIIVTNSS
jgi:hypothetical protein